MHYAGHVERSAYEHSSVGLRGPARPKAGRKVCMIRVRYCDYTRQITRQLIPWQERTMAVYYINKTDYTALRSLTVAGSLIRVK